MSSPAEFAYFPDGRLAAARYASGSLAVEADDAARTVTAYDETGAVASARPYTTAENAAADAAVVTAAEQAAAEAKAAEDRAILDAIAHTSAAAHVDGQAWTQPTGAHDAYALGATVTHGGKTWVSLTPANVWAPGVSGWREVVAEGPAAWVQPTGGHDAYPLGAKVTHKGKTWTSTAAANVWEPGVYGWA